MDGAKGENGVRGTDGQWGAPGRDGEAKTFNMKRVDKRDDDFYELEIEVQGAFIIS